MKGINVLLKKVDVNGGRHGMMDKLLGVMLTAGQVL
jgi:hypothetical protein